MKRLNFDIKSFIAGILVTMIVLVFAASKPSFGTAHNYKINMYVEPENLESWVNAEMKKGWQPKGGVSICWVQYSDKKWSLAYSQAMVKH